MVNMSSKCIDQCIAIICQGPSQTDHRKDIAQCLQLSCNTKDSNWTMCTQSHSCEIYEANYDTDNEYELNDVTNGAVRL